MGRGASRTSLTRRIGSLWWSAGGGFGLLACDGPGSRDPAALRRAVGAGCRRLFAGHATRGAAIGLAVARGGCVLSRRDLGRASEHGTRSAAGAARCRPDVVGVLLLRVQGGLRPPRADSRRELLPDDRSRTARLSLADAEPS